MPEPLELTREPADFPARRTRRSVQPRRDLPGARVDAGDHPRVAVVDVPPLVGVGELHPVPDREVCGTVLRLELDVRTAQLAALAPHLAQLRVDPRHVCVGVREHKPARHRVRQRVGLPAFHQRRPRGLAVSGPDDRAVPVVGRHRTVEPALGQIARGLALPVHLLPRHLGDLGRAVLLAQLGEQSAALDAGKLPVVAGKNHLGPCPLRLGQHLAGHPAVQHRRLVDHHDGAPVPARAAVLDPEQSRMHRARLDEAVRLQVLGHGVRGGQSHDTVASGLVCRAHRRQCVALARAGPALDQL